jgi:predicted enzyme related to lactoylglutathione lyase
MTTPTTTPTTSAAPTHTPAANGGRFVWHDLMTSDATAGLAFYQALFGWTTSSMDMGDMGTYTVVEAHGSGLGGVVPLDPSHGVPSHWIAYVTTADVDATTAHAQSLGATVGVPPTDIPTSGASRSWRIRPARTSPPSAATVPTCRRRPTRRWARSRGTS